MKHLLLSMMVALGSLISGPVVAQTTEFPSGPVTLVLPVAAGDGFDSAARILAEELTKHLRTTVLVDNRPGAGGALSVAELMRGPKDGHKVLMAINASLTFRPVLQAASTSYDPFKDLHPISLAERTPSVLVIGNEQPFSDFKGMVDYARKNPGKVRLGTAGQGSIGDFDVEIVNGLTQAAIVSVPFKGSAPAITAMRGGHVEGVIVSLGSVSGTLKAGAAKAVALSDKFPGYESVPTLKELGYGQDLIGVWTAFVVPAGVPENTVKVLDAAFAKALRDPAVSARILPLGILNDYQPASRVLTLMRDETAVVKDIGKKIGLAK
jgi:tripartite-type tricarboxylate transporter receptor subunit TctC